MYNDSNRLGADGEHQNSNVFADFRSSTLKRPAYPINYPGWRSQENRHEQEEFDLGRHIGIGRIGHVREYFRQNVLIYRPDTMLRQNRRRHT